MKSVRNAILLALLATAACASSDNPGDGDPDAAPPAPDAYVPLADARPSPTNAAVWAHSATDLYRVNPDNLAVTHVAAFSFAGTADDITDIAVDKDGTMIGISTSKVYSIDSETAVCTYLADMAGNFSSLSFVPKNPNDLASPDILVAAAKDGSVFEIDPSDGSSTSLGSYANNYGSSGDIVSVRGFGTLATVNVPNQTNDSLAWIDPVTWNATIIGDTGFDRIFGLGFWKKKVYGFTSEMKFLEIDYTTGVATEIETGTISWWGAGVTTTAPIVE